MSSTDAVIHSIAHAQLHDEAHLLARIPLRALHELMILAAGPRGDEIDWVRVRTSFRRVSAEARVWTRNCGKHVPSLAHRSLFPLVGYGPWRMTGSAVPW